MAPIVLNPYTNKNRKSGRIGRTGRRLAYLIMDILN